MKTILKELFGISSKQKPLETSVKFHAADENLELNTNNFSKIIENNSDSLSDDSDEETVKDLVLEKLKSHDFLSEGAKKFLWNEYSELMKSPMSRNGQYETYLKQLDVHPYLKCEKFIENKMIEIRKNEIYRHNKM